MELEAQAGRAGGHDERAIIRVVEELALGPGYPQVIAAHPAQSGDEIGHCTVDDSLIDVIVSAQDRVRSPLLKRPLQFKGRPVHPRRVRRVVEVDDLPGGCGCRQGRLQPLGLHGVRSGAVRFPLDAVQCEEMYRTLDEVVVALRGGGA